MEEKQASMNCDDLWREMGSPWECDVYPWDIPNYYLGNVTPNHHPQFHLSSDLVPLAEGFLPKNWNSF